MQIYVGVFKRALMDSVGFYSQSIQDWHASYKRHGLTGLLNHIKTAFIPR